MTEPDPIAALAAQLEQLRGQLARYTGETGHLRARLDADSGQAALLHLQVKELREKLKEATRDRESEEPGQMRARLDTVAGKVEDLRLEIKQLAENLESATRKREAEEPAAPCWAGLDPDERTARLGELREWVEHVARVQWPGYLATLPACWPAHGEAVWELSNLMTEWHRIYSDPDNRPLPDALMYFDRWLPGVLARLERAARCDASGCRLVKASPWERPRPRYT